MRPATSTFLHLIDEGESATAARTYLGAERAGRRVQLKLFTEARLTRLFERRSTFAVHVLREAVVVCDLSGSFGELSRRHSRDEPVCDNREQLLIRLELYEDLEWCQGLYLYCLADLYSIGRAAAYTVLGLDSRFEFSAIQALSSVGRYRPDLAVAANTAAFFLTCRT